MYIVAHLLGWFVKYLAIRNVKMSLFLSFLFEMMEITFSNWLPNFIECWWDQVILDFLGMNMLGMILGYILVDYFKMKNYGWLETKNKPKMPEYCSKLSRVSIKGEKKRSACDEITNTSTDKTKNLIKYFTPNEVIIYEWDVFSSSWRFFTVLWFVATCILCDLSHFFLKTVLWLPITHWVLAFRIFLWGFMCIIASREFYEYITNPVCKALGHFIWLTQLILFTEWMIIIKFREDLFTAPFDEKVIYCWTATIIVLIIIAVKLIIQDFIKLLKSGPSEKIDRNVIDVEYH